MTVHQSAQPINSGMKQSFHGRLNVLILTYSDVHDTVVTRVKSRRIDAVPPKNSLQRGGEQNSNLNNAQQTKVHTVPQYSESHNLALLSVQQCTPDRADKTTAARQWEP